MYISPFSRAYGIITEKAIDGLLSYDWSCRIRMINTGRGLLASCHENWRLGGKSQIESLNLSIRGIKLFPGCQMRDLLSNLSKILFDNRVYFFVLINEICHLFAYFIFPRYVLQWY